MPISPMLKKVIFAPYGALAADLLQVMYFLSDQANWSEVHPSRDMMYFLIASVHKAAISKGVMIPMEFSNVLNRIEGKGPLGNRQV